MPNDISARIEKNASGGFVQIANSLGDLTKPENRFWTSTKSSTTPGSFPFRLLPTYIGPSSPWNMPFPSAAPSANSSPSDNSLRR